MTICELLGLHNWCEARTLDFAMMAVRDSRLRSQAPVLVRVKSGSKSNDFVITARTDGLACTRCGLFVPEAA